MILNNTGSGPAFGMSQNWRNQMRYIKEITLTVLLSIVWLGGVNRSEAEGKKPPLREVQIIDDTLLVIALANEIREYCGAINGRVFKAMGIMRGLKRHANGLGYSDDEIRAYVTSDSEKARMRKRGEKYLFAKGVTYDEPETFCALGRAEIEKNSAIGALLRAK